MFPVSTTVVFFFFIIYFDLNARLLLKLSFGNLKIMFQTHFTLFHLLTKMLIENNVYISEFL